jgi:hypothetical protein
MFNKINLFISFLQMKIYLFPTKWRLEKWESDRWLFWLFVGPDLRRAALWPRSLAAARGRRGSVLAGGVPACCG